MYTLKKLGTSAKVDALEEECSSILNLLTFPPPPPPPPSLPPSY